MNKNKFIERIESGLLSTLLNYVVPFVGNKIQAKGAESNNLEKIVNNQKPKIDIKDINELESMLQRNLNQNTKLNKKTEIISSNIVYSLTFVKQKNNDSKSTGFSVSIHYEESQDEEKLNIKIKKYEKDVHFAEIIDKKEAKDKVAPYNIKISYEENYFEERLSITYKQQLKSYLQEFINSKEDMTNRVPLKWLNILPETMMGGVLGFTYLGENFMGRRADLTGKTARMVDIHESIHTPDEYETRVLTDWIMQKPRLKYFK